MKKLIVSLCALLFSASLSFAETAQAPASSALAIQPAPVQTAPAPVITKDFTGKVDAVIIGDTEKGTQSELVVLDDSGQQSSFVVKSGTPIADKDAKVLALTDLKKDNKVAIEYVLKATGAKKARSIKLLE